jgi:hypothetical protein
MKESKMKPRVYIKLIVFALVFAALLVTYGTTAAYPTEEERHILCADGHEPVGDLGITSMKMKGSVYLDTDAGEHWWHFQAEPKIREIDPDGPSAGILKPGDIIVAIDGLAITTRKAGKRFGNLVPGEPVEITVRRGGRRLDLEIKPLAVCLEEHPLHVHVPEAPDVPAISIKLDELSKKLESLAVIDIPDIPDMPDMPDISHITDLDFRPQAWFGMGISCSDCTINTGKNGESARWQFDNPPKVESVDPGGPADQSGLRKGDVLTHIDGARLDSRKGGQRFSSVEPGETITWKIKRGTQHLTVEMYALEHPEREVRAAPPVATRHVLVNENSPVLFSGILGGTDIEVRGERSIEVTRDEERNVIVIKTGDAVIRLRLVEKTD